MSAWKNGNANAKKNKMEKKKKKKRFENNISEAVALNQPSIHFAHSSNAFSTHAETCGDPGKRTAATAVENEIEK